MPQLTEVTLPLPPQAVKALQRLATAKGLDLDYLTLIAANHPPEGLPEPLMLRVALTTPRQPLPSWAKTRQEHIMYLILSELYETRR